MLLDKLGGNLTLRERITFMLHLGYALCDGIGLGIIALNEFVLLKTLGASTYQISVLQQMQVVMMPFCIFITDFMDWVRSKKKMLVYMAIATRLPLLVFVFYPADVIDHEYRQLFIALYMIIFALYYIANPFILPTLNLFSKNIYSPSRFGKLFSYCLTLTQLLVFVVTLLFGHLLDWQPGIYRIVFPVLSLVIYSGSAFGLAGFQEKLAPLAGT